MELSRMNVFHKYNSVPNVVQDIAQRLKNPTNAHHTSKG